MCARSHTSGLISAEWAVSTAASESPETSASVRSRASARSAAAVAARCCVAVTDRTLAGRARAPPDLDHLAHGRRPPRDARVERAHDQLEAARLELLELGDQRVEAPPL